MRVTKDSKAITLIALVITIIVLLILAGVALATLTGNTSIIDNANYAVVEYNKSAGNDQNVLNQVENLFAKYMGGNSSTGDDDDTPHMGENSDTGDNDDDDDDTPETTVSKEPTDEGFVGCYADIDRDGEIDGIIYADLLVGEPESPWQAEVSYGASGTFTLLTDVTKANVKDYVISQTAQVDTRWDSTPRDVISPARTTTGTKDRFYVMQLEDISMPVEDTADDDDDDDDDDENYRFYWYYTPGYYDSNIHITDYNELTSTDFGSGRSNTIAMQAKWNEQAYGTKNDGDLWKWIDIGEGGANEGWFLPSMEELRAFAQGLNVNNHVNGWDMPYNLRGSYWSSSLYSASGAWYLDSGYLAMFDYGIDNNYFYVRLSTTF